MRNQKRPIHPGEHLREELAELELSAAKFAALLAVPMNRVTQILNHKHAVSADTALRLARYFGTTPEFWMQLQAAYDLRLAERKSGKAIARRVNPRAA
ncbi:MAG: addiction module antidote protein, HigA family [Acidobacteria bacterium]|nr:MAG: addiction module antidote protein, HigA family [Acidobacteriota bacterium]